jgi:tight adherence protein B
MNVAVVVALISAVLMAGGAVLLWSGAPKQDRRGLISKRLEAWASMHPHELERRADERTGMLRIAWFARLIVRGGIDFTQNTQAAVAGIPVVVLPLLAILFGAWAVLAFVALYPFALYAVLKWKIRRFARELVARLPGYLDGVARSLAVGNTMPVALKLAMEQSIEPIPQVFRQVVQRHELGVSIESALEQVAATYQIRELALLASAVTVNSRYGGKLEAVLSNIANAIREHDNAQRELIAMTAETRLSSWILSGLPVLIALMLAASNPQYMRGMWLDESGRWMLIVAFALDFAGTLILLRMGRI